MASCNGFSGNKVDVKLNTVNNGFLDKKIVNASSGERVDSNVSDEAIPGKSHLQFLSSVFDVVIKDGLIDAMDRNT